MKAGKISESVLRRSVLGNLRSISCEGGYASGVGCDYADLSLEEGERVVLAVNPVTRTRREIGRSGIFESLNNVACSGARPLGVLVSILLPTSSNERELRELVKELDAAARECGTVVVGGHTEVTRRVQETLVTVTGIGTVRQGRMMRPQSAEPGMELVATKWIGLEGTAILSMEREAELRKRFPGSFVEEAIGFRRLHSILPEAAVAAECGAAVLHDVSEGGIFGALWELGQASGVGLEVELRSIPVRQETVEICEYFDINPYKLISGGCLLVAVDKGAQLVAALHREGIRAAVIGRTTEGNDRVLLNGEERRFLETTQTDELYKVIP